MRWDLVVPRGDWIAEYPSTNGRIVLALRLSFLFVVFILALIAFILLRYEPKDVPWNVVSNLLELEGWFLAGMMGLGIAQFIGKRATANPETIRAISETKLAEAKVLPQPVAGPHPAQDPAISKALELEAARREALARGEG